MVYDVLWSDCSHRRNERKIPQGEDDYMKGYKGEEKKGATCELRRRPQEKTVEHLFFKPPSLTAVK